MERAAPIAVREVNQFINAEPDAFDEVIFVCFGDRAVKAYEDILKSSPQ